MTVHVEPSLWSVTENHGTDPCGPWGHEECAVGADGPCSLWPQERWPGLRAPDGMAPSRMRVLVELAGGPKCATDLGRGGFRFGARIHELRRDGFTIERRRCRRPFHVHPVNDRLDEYVLVAVPAGLMA